MNLFGRNCGKARTAIGIILAALLFAPLPAGSKTAALPDMGDASAAVLTPEKERRIGKALWRQLRQSGKLVEDPELNRYLRTLGYRLLAASEYGQRDFTFFLVDEPSVNAFALPGGYIGVHAGLITATQSEDELAAVLAHEIAHVTQNHLARGYEKANRMNLPMSAAVIAAILLGAQSPELAEAAIAASTAGAAQMQIDFTRAHEQEADRLGIEMLAGAGYDPHSMGGFFEKLQQETRYYGDGIPEFLRTHPIHGSRIADAEGRASQMTVAERPEDYQFWTTRAYLQVRLTDDPAALARQLRSRLATGQSVNPEADRFALALTLEALGDSEEARRILKAFVEDDPQRLAYRLALARLAIRQGDHGEASRLLKAGLELYPDNTALLLALGENHLQQGNPVAAREAFESAIRESMDTPPTTFRLLSRAEAALGNEAASRLALAEYYFRLGETHSAIDQLQTAQTYAGDDFYLASRIDARLEQFKREAELESQ